MRCDWESLLSVLPIWMRNDVNRLGKDSLQELRLRLNHPPDLIFREGRQALNRIVALDDLNFCINTASRYSPWAASTISKGFLTAPGGHRIGICGEVVCKNGQTDTFRTVSSVCIRIARDFPGIGRNAPSNSSLLILGAPGWGKTTLLRDTIRCRSETGMQIAVVDERGELFPGNAFPAGACTDILTGCSKSQGIYMLLRTMGPMCIAVDEITQPEDCDALIQAAGCGVSLLATAHASGLDDLKRRPVYKPLLESGVFEKALILRPDKSWRMERI